MKAGGFERLAEAVKSQPPTMALVLGSGLNFIADRVKPIQSVSYVDIPGLGQTSVAGHRGCLTLGNWLEHRVLLFEGRLHFYEGHPWAKVVTPVRIAAELGVKTLLLTNAAGGIHDALNSGSFMAITDHIEWTREYGWRHPGPGSLSKSRPSPYSPRLIEHVRAAANMAGCKIHAGVYAAVTGPSYETPAEIRALRHWGADAVGMSTVREIQTGYDLGLECGAISCITNRAAGLSSTPLSHDEVLHTAAAQGESLGQVLDFLVRVIHKD